MAQSRSPKATITTTIRFDPAIKRALARAAQSHHRSAASMLHEILREWLTAKHFL